MVSWAFSSSVNYVYWQLSQFHVSPSSSLFSSHTPYEGVTLLQVPVTDFGCMFISQFFEPCREIKIMVLRNGPYIYVHVVLEIGGKIALFDWGRKPDFWFKVLGAPKIEVSIRYPFADISVPPPLIFLSLQWWIRCWKDRVHQVHFEVFIRCQLRDRRIGEHSKCRRCYPTEQVIHYWNIPRRSSKTLQ